MTNQIFNSETAAIKLRRMALEVAESFPPGSSELLIYGIGTNGFVVANQLAVYLSGRIPFLKVFELKMDKSHPETAVLWQNEAQKEGGNILLVDDVINSGRTMCYALKPLLQLHPVRVQTLVLVERMHKLFPVKPDYVGVKIATAEDDFIVVETDNRTVTRAFVR